MSAMKNVAMAMEEVLMILDDLPEGQRNYLIANLPESDAQRRAEELGIDVPSEFSAAEWMTHRADLERSERRSNIQRSNIQCHLADGWVGPLD